MLDRGHNFGVLCALVVAIFVLLVPVAQAAPTCPPSAVLEDVHSGATTSGTITCDDPGGTGLNWSVDPGDDAAHGFVQFDQAGTVVYTANPDYAGPDSFTVVVSDNEGGSVDISVSVTVTNAAPTCQALNIGSTPHDTATYGFPSCNDPDGDAVTLVVTEQPAHGTAAPDFGGIVYTPAAGYSGADSFKFAAFDGVVTGPAVNATVTVTNAAPNCDNTSTTLRANKASEISVICTDAEFDTLGLTATQPSHGTVSAVHNGNQFTYTPEADFVGTDSFTVKANDGHADSSPATVSVTVTPNHAPTCYSQTPHAKVGTALSITPLCSDQDPQETLQYTVTASPGHGTLTPPTLTGFDSWTYTPMNGFTGSDSFSFSVTDGDLTTNQTVTIHVSDHPMCSTPPPLEVRSGKSTMITVDCTVPADPFALLTYVIDTQPTQGTLTNLGGGAFSYAAASGASGPDSFSFHVTASSDASPTVTQLITTGSAVNHAPDCSQSQQATAYSGHATALFPFCTDADFDSVTVSPGAQPAHGVTADGAGGGISYTPDAEYTGSDSVAFVAHDGHGGDTPGAMTIDVKAPEAPNCTQGSIDVSVRPTKTVTLSLSCGNPQGDPQTYSTAATPALGSLGAFTGGDVVYTAGANGGTDTFTLIAHNAAGDSSPQQVTVHVDANYNRAPNCADNFSASKKVAKNTPRDLDLSSVCTDPDGDPMTFTRVSPPANGSVSAGPAALLTYTPTLNYTGHDSFGYSATDSHGATSAVTTYRIEVVDSLAPTCTPVATLTLRPGQTRGVNFNCSDSEFNQVTYKIVDQPAKGSLSPSGDSTNSSRSYTAGAGTGSDSFTYRATSANGESILYTQNVSISDAANVAPSCGSNAALPQSVIQGHAAKLKLTTVCFDQDGDALTSSAAGPPTPQHGSVVTQDGSVFYTANLGYVGTDSIGVDVADGHGGTTHTTFTVDVLPPSANHAPTCTAVQKTTPNSTPVSVKLTCSDQDDDGVTLSIVDAPDAAKGSLGGIDAATGDVQFTPAGTFSGEATFTYKASDGQADSAPATATITVQAPAQVGDGGDGGGGDGGGGAGSGDPSGGGSTPPPGGTGSPQPGATTTSTPSPTDTTPPAGGATTPPALTLTLAKLPKLKLAALLKSGLPLRASCSVRCSLTAKLILPKSLAKKLKLGKKDLPIASVKKSVGSSQTKLVLKISAKLRKKLAKLRSLQVKLQVNGANAPLTRTLTFKR